MVEAEGTAQAAGVIIHTAPVMAHAAGAITNTAPVIAQATLAATQAEAGALEVAATLATPAVAATTPPVTPVTPEQTRPPVATVISDVSSSSGSDMPGSLTASAVIQSNGNIISRVIPEILFLPLYISEL